jgi:hypothetical protein
MSASAEDQYGYHPEDPTGATGRGRSRNTEPVGHDFFGGRPPADRRPSVDAADPLGGRRPSAEAQRYAPAMDAGGRGGRGPGGYPDERDGGGYPPERDSAGRDSYARDPYARDAYAPDPYADPPRADPRAADPRAADPRAAGSRSADPYAPGEANGYGSDRYARESFGADPFAFDRDGSDRGGSDRGGSDRGGADRGGADRDTYGRDGFDRDPYRSGGAAPDAYGRDGFDSYGRADFDGHGGAPAYERGRGGADQVGFDRGAPDGGLRENAYATCPNCHVANEPHAHFCETCGYDLAQQDYPAAPEPVAIQSSWDVLVEAEREYYDSGDDHRVPFPAVYPRRVFPLTGGRLLVGRRSESRGIHPDVDLSGAPEDPGISRAHAMLELLPDGNYALLDPGSTNGTRINDEPEPIEPGHPIPLRSGDRIYLGAWTRLTIRGR